MDRAEAAQRVREALADGRPARCAEIVERTGLTWDEVDVGLVELGALRSDGDVVRFATHPETFALRGSP